MLKIKVIISIFCVLILFVATIMSESAMRDNSLRNFIGNANTTTDITKLQSRPGMPYVIYLYFDPKKNASYDLKRTIWEQISDDWIMFKVNVTTDKSVYDQMKPTQRAKCTFTTYFANGGGNGNPVTGEKGAIINLKQNYVPKSGGDYLFRTPSHELGHEFGLSHDNCTSPWQEYYSGHGEYCPIMGSTNSKTVTQWSKGEYNGAGNQEDDIAIIGSQLGFVDDDKPNPVSLVIENDGSVLPEKNNGTITSQDDTDEFTFVVTDKAYINITGDPSIKYPNLDIGLTLKDSNGNEIENDEPVGLRTATIKTTITTPGTYTLVVDGVGELTPSEGWSDYASMGYYQLKGTIIGGSVSNIVDNKKTNFANNKTVSISYNSKTKMLFINGSTDYTNYQIISVNGLLIKSDKKSNQINLSNFTAGVYILALKNGSVLVKSKLFTIN